MSKTAMTAAFAAAVALAAPVALTASAVAQTSAATATVIQPDQIRASRFIGSTVYDVQNRNIGDVKDIILDRNGRVDEVVLDVGAFLGMGGKYVAVNLSDFKMNNNRLTLDRSKEQLQQAQAFQLEDRNTGAGTSATPAQGNTRPGAGR
ncbi:MAG: PRC-barrel domain-containing protein [Alphaproteobacteria bacterium]|nr:PRC-barrel domain-containing protein [Alphaproteobacteria bacterium]